MPRRKANPATPATPPAAADDDPRAASLSNFLPGERLFAWTVVGLSAEGDDAHAMGFVSATDKAAALAEVNRRMPEVQADCPETAPRLKLRMWVQECPIEWAAALLLANGFGITPPKAGGAT
jgi:hypothetical protein